MNVCVVRNCSAVSFFLNKTVKFVETDARLKAEIASQPYPLLFATVSGAHLYGFPSPDSDYDLRGVHLLPATEVLSLHADKETIEVSKTEDGLEFDLVTHDAGKFFRLMLKRNGYVLEQLYSPLVLHTTPEHEELKAIGGNCVTRHHVHHYRGFVRTQWQLFEKDKPRRVKPLLYVYRILMTGIHLMRTGRVEANIVILNEDFKLSFIEDLIARKKEGSEKETLADADLLFYRNEYERLAQALELARDESTLPDTPSAYDALSDLLVRVRLKSLA